MKIAVCPGSFDPITVDHLDLVERGAALFDRVILCVMVNGEKHPMFTPEERLEMARAALSHIPNASAEAWDGLLADGIDFEWEYQMAQINRGLLPELDTLLLPARAEHLHISSTMVRDMIRYHQTLDQCMPAPAAAVLQRIREGKVY